MGTVKTTLSIDERLWKEFSIAVIEKEGYRKKNKIVEELVREYVKRKNRKGG